ncbi:Protein of unknown function [Pyronema omphalodes CBS 100304]|uniref:Uncharacterized protein n=1 Tax=Pyronema omphalodes (strain CBS 100304) TaxID=1076935 RepID=U4LPD5_PYROM|nr:Protein of unknown function [Pyronema omphalodes CBS 100304]
MVSFAFLCFPWPSLAFLCLLLCFCASCPTVLRTLLTSALPAPMTTILVVSEKMLAPVSRFFVIQESEYAGSHTADSPKQGSPGPQALRVHNWLERCTQDASNDDPADTTLPTVDGATQNIADVGQLFKVLELSL